MDSKQQELDALIRRIEKYQADIGLSDSRFGARYAHYIGSPKTWTDRLKPRAYESIKAKIEKWSGKLRQFIDEIDGLHHAQVTFEEFPIVRHAARLYDTLAAQRDDRRCAMLIGVQGTGKTLALRHLQAMHPAATKFFSANETWKDSRMCIASAIASGIGSPVETSASGTFIKALARLKEQPITLLIDEAHEGGVLLMKLVKTIINETPARIIMAQYPTSWNRLNNGANDAYAEAQQILRRTQRPVRMNWINGLRAEDVEAFFKAHKLTAGFNAALIRELLPIVQQHGNYSLLADAFDMSSKLADEGDEDITPQIFKASVREICGLPAEKPAKEAVA